MNTHETYVSLETAKLLKQAGFDWECPDKYERSIMACRYEDYEKPTLSVAQKWLREVKGYHICVEPTNSEVNKDMHKCDVVYLIMIFVNNNNIGGIDFVEMIEHFKTHEEALEAGIKKYLEIILKEE